ncbi:hypothetical protein MNBD_BACTEROID06-567 [hydrothermal vent metagenome]|uniref:4-hydroxybenzoyl-CoA thioesterase family active site n=1 Tax=hydrothermal vent metagenome TaxID=652676 RepID=A0A3B0V1X8_9ZZZZ
MQEFNFKISVQFRYSDFDMLGHLNSAQYVTILELGRLEYFRAINWNLKEVSNVVASFKIDYLNQIIPTNEVMVHVRITRLGNKSFSMQYAMASPDESIIYAKAETEQVCILKNGNTSTPIPAQIKKQITLFEKL